MAAHGAVHLNGYPWGQKIALVLVPFSLVYPFWFQKLISRNSDLMRARGKDPEETVLLVATALSAQPSAFAFFLFLLGGPAKHAYYASALSIVGALYWAWRYRHILLGATGLSCTGH